MSSQRPKSTITIVGETPVNTTSEKTILLVGTMLSSGTATSNEIVSDLISDLEAETFFGKKSIIAAMYKRFREINKKTRVDILPLTEPIGDPSTASVEFSGTATASGTLEVQVASAKKGAVSLSIAKGETASQIATRLNTSLTSLLDALPMSSGVNTGKVTITGSQDGVELNDAFIGVYGTVAGITYTVTEFANGTATPTIDATIINAIPDDIRYKYVVLSKECMKTLFVTEFEQRFNVENQLIRGEVIQALDGTYANLNSAIDALNNRAESYLCSKIINFSNAKGVGIRELTTLAVIDFVAVSTLALTTDAPITSYIPVSAVNAKDSLGGQALASLSYANRIYPTLPPLLTNYGFTKAQVDELENSGGIVWQNNRSGLNLTTSEGVTTYKTNAIGVADNSFKYKNYIDQITEFEILFNERYYARFGTARLGGNQIRAQRGMVNQQLFEAFLDELYLESTNEPYILMRAGKEEEKFFKQNRTASLNYSTGKITWSASTPLVSQLRNAVGIITMTFNF